MGTRSPEARRVLLLVLAGAALGGVAVWSSTGRATPPSPPPARRAAPVEAAPATPEALATPSAAEGARVPVAAAPPEGRRPAPGERAAAPTTLSVLGALVDPSGYPTAGKVRIEALDAKGGLQRTRWTRADAAGRYEATLPRNGATARVAVSASAPVWAEARWSGEATGELVRLPTLSLFDFCAVRGRLVGMLDDWSAWSVFAATTPTRPGTARLSRRAPVSEDGSFVLSDVPPGEVHVRAHHPLVPFASERVVRCAPGTFATVLLPWSGPDPERCVAVVYRATDEASAVSAVARAHGVEYASRCVDPDGGLHLIPVDGEHADSVHVREDVAVPSSIDVRTSIHLRNRAAARDRRVGGR